MYVNINRLKQLSAMKAAIKKGERSKKLQDLDIHSGIEKLYKPVIDPLKEIAHDQKLITKAIELDINIPAIEQPPPKVIPAIEGPPTLHYDTLTLGVLADRYLKVPSIQYDHAYGIKPIEGSTNFRLGRMDVKIEGDDFIIDGERYTGTEDLWKLLTLKNPGDVSAEDLATYKEMMLQTKAFLLEGQDRVKCTRGNKYKNIVKPIADAWKNISSYSTPGGPETPVTRLSKRQRAESFSGTTSSFIPTGSGIIFLPSDPNELVDRFRILFGAYQAGNTGVFNEVQAINDKLLELGIFDIEMIRKLNTIINADNKY